MQDWLMKYWLAALFGAVLTGLGEVVRRLWKRQHAQADEQGAVKAGVVALLHDRIYQEYGFCQRRGYATVDDIKNMEYLYRPYHALGGNGTGTELFERVKRMPENPAEMEKNI